MSNSPRPIIALLLFLSALGAYTTFYFAAHNTLLNRLRDIRDHGPYVLPGTHAPLIKRYTGISIIDYQLAVSVVLFLRLIDGSHPSASIHAGHFAGQLGATWGLMMLESCRVGNKGKLFRFTVFWGLIMQNLGYAVIFPLQLALHLATSPMKRPSILAKDIVILPGDNASLPYALTLGYVVPSVILVLPAPSILSYNAKQWANAIWQCFPIWVCLGHKLFKRIIHPSREALHTAHIFLIILASTTHISALALSVCPFFMNPAGRVSFWSTFIPSKIWPWTEVESLAEGVHLFMQYDEIVGSIALLVWAVYLHVIGTGQGWTASIVKALGWTVLLGPSGAAVVLMYERDRSAGSLGRTSAI